MLQETFFARLMGGGGGGTQERFSTLSNNRFFSSREITGNIGNITSGRKKLRREHFPKIVGLPPCKKGGPILNVVDTIHWAVPGS